MTKQEYLRSTNRFAIDQNKLQTIYAIYAGRFPEALERIISGSNESVFFDDDDMRILSFAEMVDAEQDLHIDFKSKKLMPIADCGDNDFIVYDYANNVWAKFNIVDETIFMKRAELGELLK